MKKKGLGKGLRELGVDELLSSTLVVEPRVSTGLRELPVSALQPGRYQPRRQINKETLVELAESIRTQGIIQPIVVRPVEGGGYEIIAGERRWRAAQLVELETVPVVVRQVNDETALAMSLIENIQREDLNVIDEAIALQRLMDEFSMTHQEVATAVGKSRASVTNLLRLLKLAPEVRDQVEQGLLDMGHARALLALTQGQQVEVAETIIGKELSVREAEELIRKRQEPQKSARPKEKLLNQDSERLEKNLSVKLNTEVLIKQNSKGRGKLIIQYKNLDQLDRILQRIQ